MQEATAAAIEIGRCSLDRGRKVRFVLVVERQGQAYDSFRRTAAPEYRRTLVGAVDAPPGPQHTQAGEV
jgi:hypothetical protein